MTKSDWNGKRVAVYGRYSSDKQNPTSADDQIDRGVRLADERGCIVPSANRLKDDAVSGSKSHRAGLDSLMQMVRARELDIVVVEDIDRLSRDLSNTLALFKEFAWNDVELVSMSDGMSSRAPTAKTHIVFRGHMSESFLDNLRDKTYRGQLSRFMSGHATGAVPFGFGTTPKKNLDGEIVARIIHIDEVQAAVVRRIFKVTVQEAGPRSAAHIPAISSRTDSARVSCAGVIYGRGVRPA